MIEYLLTVILGVIIGLALPVFKRFNYVIWLELKLAQAREDLRQIQQIRQQPWLTGATTEYHLQKHITKLETENGFLQARISALEANVSKSVLRRLDAQLGDK